MVKPTAVSKWEFEGFIPDKWSDVFLLPYICTRSTKLQAFQYQIIHRYIPTRKFLFVRRITDDPNCNRCNNVDTLAHHFFSCPTVADFWDIVMGYINTYYTEFINPSANDILFGITNVSPVINLLIILAKHYIHACANRKIPLVFNSYLAYVTDVYRTERRAAAGCLELFPIFIDKWSLFPISH